MRQLKIAIVLVVAILLQSSLRNIWQPLVYIDLPLIVVVYFALQRRFPALSERAGAPPPPKPKPAPAPA